MGSSGTFRLPILLLLSLLLGGCSPRGPFEETLLERPDLAIYLQRASRGHYDHPQELRVEPLTEILTALRFAPNRNGYPLFPRPVARKLAEAIAKGFKKAKPEELVSFVWVMPAPSFQERITSGGAFVFDGELHLVIANANLLHATWQPDKAKPPSDLRPLEPMEPQRGRISVEGPFVWREVPTTLSAFRSVYYGDAPWHIAISLPQGER